MIKGQDIVVLAVPMEKGAERLAYAELGKAVRVSVSEAHAAVKRLQEASLLNSERCPVKGHVEEFRFTVCAIRWRTCEAIRCNDLLTVAAELCYNPLC